MITPESPNLFTALFAFHPREGYSPRENFLSEAFAYVLRTVDGACEAWVSKLVRQPTKLVNPRIATRYSEDGVFPDLKIEADLVTGERLTIYAEHKWDSPCHEMQLQNYANIAIKCSGQAFLVFVGARFDQMRIAKAARTAIPCHAFLWEDAYDSLKQLKNRHVILDQFLDFMETHGLSPGKAITTRQMQAFLESADFMRCLQHYTERLLTDYDWTQIPERYRENPVVWNRWGRTAIEFVSPGWAPTLTVGFLYATADHVVSFTAPKDGIDFFVRFECNPSRNPTPTKALALLGEKAARLRDLGGRVLLKGEHGNGNIHTLFIAQKSLASIIRGGTTEREHLEGIYATVHSWLDALFADGRLEEGLKTIVA